MHTSHDDYPESWTALPFQLEGPPIIPANYTSLMILCQSSYHRWGAT